MNITDVWMQLEALAHLRELPQYSAIRKQIEGELAVYNDSIGKPKSIPAAQLQPESTGDAPVEIERRL